jgi:hypothetical protein
MLFINPADIVRCLRKGLAEATLVLTLGQVNFKPEKHNSSTANTTNKCFRSFTPNTNRNSTG